jgi:glycosyltransferase involved in cell wall biosynthesis
MLFSVIVPIFKVEEYLPRCVDSILAQSFPDFELILVDDGSPDRCGELCDAYAERDARVRVIHKENGGLVSARNAGIFAAEGEYICYVDGDDWVEPEMLSFVAEKLREAPTPPDMIVFGAEKVFADRSEPMPNLLPDGYYDRERLEREVFPYLLSDRRSGFRPAEQLQCHTWNKPCRRALQREHYVRDERIRMHTDVPMTVEILLDCRCVYICSEPLYHYNACNPSSILTLGQQNYLTGSFRCLVDYMRVRLAGCGADILRQINDYADLLIIRTAISRLQHCGSFREAVRLVREGLDESGMLSAVSLKELPLRPRLMTLLFKLRLDRAAMALCALRLRFPRR